MNDNEWNPAEHITYMHCSETDGVLKYYVILNKKGEFVNTAKNLNEALEKAIGNGLENHCWITALPMYGAPITIPNNIAESGNEINRNENI